VSASGLLAIVKTGSIFEGDDPEMSKTQKIQKVVVNVTSIIPNLSSSSSSDIQACLSNYTSFVDSTVTNNKQYLTA
jgi:hypothetical protein